MFLTMIILQGKVQDTRYPLHVFFIFLFLIIIIIFLIFGRRRIQWKEKKRKRKQTVYKDQEAILRDPFLETWAYEILEEFK